MCKNHVKLTIFLTEINFPAYFFSSDICQKGRCYLFIFSPTEQKKKPCRTSSTKQYTSDALILIMEVGDSDYNGLLLNLKT